MVAPVAGPSPDLQSSSRFTRLGAAEGAGKPRRSAGLPRDPLRISGTLLGGTYRIGEVIGDGGFSVVYRAEHVAWQQPVAIKCFKVVADATEDQQRSLFADFVREGKLMAQLSSRSAAIVQARDAGTLTAADGQCVPYLVLEWLDGKALDTVLWEEARLGLAPRRLREAVALLGPAAAAIEIAHRSGVAHRDLKPPNFFVLGDPRGASAQVKVLDFGVAKEMAGDAGSDAALAHTGTDITAFTPAYGAPEQFSRLHGATGPWTDVFAMALVLVEILRGGQQALDGDFVQMAKASRDLRRRPTPCALGVPVPDAVERVFETALAVAPADRYPSMGPFWRALVRAVSLDASPLPAVSGAPDARPPVLYAATIVDPHSPLAMTLAPPTASRRSPPRAC
jgi:serine/threonine protein kinase